jgi:hypothetical protein
VRRSLGPAEQQRTERTRETELGLRLEEKAGSTNFVITTPTGLVPAAWADSMLQVLTDARDNLVSEYPYIKMWAGLAESTHKLRN